MTKSLSDILSCITNSPVSPTSAPTPPPRQCLRSPPPPTPPLPPPPADNPDSDPHLSLLSPPPPPPPPPPADIPPSLPSPPPPPVEMETFVIQSDSRSHSRMSQTNPGVMTPAQKTPVLMDEKPERPAPPSEIIQEMQKKIDTQYRKYPKVDKTPPRPSLPSIPPVPERSNSLGRVKSNPNTPSQKRKIIVKAHPQQRTPSPSNAFLETNKLKVFAFQSIHLFQLYFSWMIVILDRSRRIS